MPSAPIRSAGNARPPQLVTLGLSGEDWREAPHTPGYWVSSFGRVFGKRGALLKPQVNRYGYLGFRVIVGGKHAHRQCHRLVCEAFNGPRPEGRNVVAHLDGDCTNNVAENLAWVTVAENNQHAVMHGTSALGERNGQSRLTPEIIKQIWSSKDGPNLLARRFGVSKTAIQKIRKRQTWGHVTSTLPERASVEGGKE